MILNKALIDNFSIKYEKYRIFFEKILIATIIIFAFFVSFNPIIGKTLVNNMFYIWILSLNFLYIYSLFRNSRIFLLIILLFFWIIASTYITPTENFYNYEQFIKYFLLPVVIISTTVQFKHIKYIISAFLIGMFVNEIISYSIYFQFIKDTFLGFKIVGTKLNPVPFLTSHIEYTLFLSLTIIISLFTIVSTKNRLYRIFLSFFVITMMTNLFLTTGRTGQFTLLATTLLLIIIYFRKNIKYIFYSVISIIIVFTLAFNFSSNVNSRIKQGIADINKIIQDKNYDSSWGIRISSYIIIPDIIKHEKFNVFYGMGYCEVDKIIQEIHIDKYGEHTTFAKTFGHLHNTYITIFAGLGFVGLFILLLLWYRLFTEKITDSYYNYIRYSFMFVISFGGVSSNLFWQRDVMLLSSIFIAVIIYITTKDNREKINE